MEKRRDESARLRLRRLRRRQNTRRRRRRRDQRLRPREKVRTNSKKKVCGCHDGVGPFFKITARKIDAMGRFEGEEGVREGSDMSVIAAATVYRVSI